MDDITSRIVKYVASSQELPEIVVAQTKKFIADYISSIVAGYKVNMQVNRAVYEIFDEMGGKEEADILFGTRKYPVCNAAFINAYYSHGADLDDGNKYSAGHIGTHVISAIFALAQKMNVTWRDVFIAINVGYDVFNRVAGGAQPSLYNKGFHSTGVAGSLASAAACARLLNLDEEGIYNAISLGAIQSSGLLIIDESGQACKPINPANAARNGIISALLAQKGVKSSRRPLESRKGWFNAFSDSIDNTILFDGLGQQFTICDSYLKKYPTCRHTHCAIEAAIQLRKKMLSSGLKIDDIKKIQLFIYPSAIKSTGTIRYPQDSEEAKFSILYCLAVALCLGDLKLADLTDIKKSKEISKVIDITEIISDASLENRKKGIRGSKLHLIFNTGKTEEEVILIPKGEASKAFSWEDVSEKMISCCEGTDINVKSIIKKIQDIQLDKSYEIWMNWIKNN